MTETDFPGSNTDQCEIMFVFDEIRCVKVRARDSDCTLILQFPSDDGTPSSFLDLEPENIPSWERDKGQLIYDLPRLGRGLMDALINFEFVCDSGNRVRRGRDSYPVLDISDELELFWFNELY